MNLTKHFTLAELTRSSTAAALNLEPLDGAAVRS